MNIFMSKHAVWLAGFRPFFILAMVMGVLMPLLWGLFFSGHLVIPVSNPMAWHAHEMLFGFGGAVLFGFLLTASKNWVGERGIHGKFLMIVTGLWVLERVMFYFLLELPIFLKHVLMSLFVVVVGIYIMSTLIKFRHKDSFNDNYFFLILLVAIVIAKNLLVSERFYIEGISLSIGLFRLAFVVMFERTITQFMKNTMNVTLVRNKFLDMSIKILVLASAFQSFLPNQVSICLLALAGLLLLVRWFLWRPDLGFKKFSNATMYIGYFGLILHFGLEALKISGIWGFAAYSIHVFTFVCMGVVIPSMMIRIANGHTGRKPEFNGIAKIAIWIILSSIIFRLILPLVYIPFYSSWILLAGLLWSTAFLLLLMKLSPLLVRPRIDGKIH